ERVCTGQQKTESGTDTGMVALMVEVVDALDNRRPSRPKSRKPSLMPNTEEGTCDSQNELVPPLTLSQLLDVNVILRSETVPSIRNFIAQSPKEHEFSKTLSGILNVETGNLGKAAQSQTIIESQPNEVTLPLRDVLNLITLVNSIEDEVAAAASNSSDSSIQDDISSPSNSPMGSLPSSITSMDHREFAPLLKASLYKPPPKHIKLRTPIRRLSQKEEDELEETLQAVFYNSSDAEETDTEGEKDSQIEEEEEEEEEEEQKKTDPTMA
ncbi:hypothetical protein OTU49_014923, partial [Cherax quadricarinatus]